MARMIAECRRPAWELAAFDRISREANVGGGGLRSPFTLCAEEPVLPARG